MNCTCKKERSYLMLIWGRHYEGCQEIRKWPSIGIPFMVLMAVLACVTSEPAKTPDPAPTTRDCCRYCTNSKACGDGCIPYENRCTKEPGCACTVRVHD